MENRVECRAVFTGCNIGKKVIMKLELDGESRNSLPALSLMTGQPVRVVLSNDQQTLFVDSGTGEIIDNQ